MSGLVEKGDLQGESDWEKGVIDFVFVATITTVVAMFKHKDVMDTRFTKIDPETSRKSLSYFLPLLNNRQITLTKNPDYNIQYPKIQNNDYCQEING